MGMVFAAIMPILVVLPGAYLVFNNDASLNSIPIVGTTLLLAVGTGLNIVQTGRNTSSRHTTVGSEYLPRRLRAEHLALYFILALTCLSLCFTLYKPLLAVVHANLGSVYQAKGELAPNLTDDEGQLYLRLARAHYDKAISCAPGKHTARQRLGRLAVDTGRYEEGVAHLTQLGGEGERNE